MEIINTTLSNSIRKRDSAFPVTAIKGKHGKDAFKIWTIGEEAQAKEEAPFGNDPTPYGSEPMDWKNFYAITTQGTIANNIGFAKSMLYDYIGVKANGALAYNNGNANGANGMKCYIINPMEGQDIFRDSIAGGLSEYSKLGPGVDNGLSLDFTEYEITAVGGGSGSNVTLTVGLDKYQKVTRSIAFTSGGTYQVVEGDTITGATSGATAKVGAIGKITSGTWAGGNAAGTLYLYDQTGTFQSENLNVGGNSDVATIAGNSSAVGTVDAQLNQFTKIYVYDITGMADGIYTVDSFSSSIITLRSSTGLTPSGVGSNARFHLSYTQAQKDWYDSHAFWKSTDTAWPTAADFYEANYGAKTRKCRFASGYIPNGSSSGLKHRTKFNMVWCMQTAAVRAYLIDRIMYSFGQMKSVHGLKPAGVGFDLFPISGNFQYFNAPNDGPYMTVNYWNYTVSGEADGHRGDINKAGLPANSCVCPTHTHDKSTVTEGFVAFITELQAAMDARRTLQQGESTPLFEEEPRYIVEPARLYIQQTPSAPTYSSTDEVVYAIKDRADKAVILPDFLCQEGVTNGVDEFANGVNTGWPAILASGVGMRKDRIGSSQPTDTGEANNRKIAAIAAINKMWYNWFLRFFSAYSQPDSIIKRLQLARCVPNWDNLNKVPENLRSWDGTTYYSKMLAGDSTYWSFMNATMYFTRSYKDTNKIYAVFMDNGAITYPSNKNISSASQIQGVDGYFAANGNGANITYDNTAKTITYSGGAVANGAGYIITLT